MSHLCWTTYAHPKTLTNVGVEAVAMLAHNTICFTNLKTKAKTYYKADIASFGAGISIIAGHNRFPLVAFVEVILRPSIYIIKYPDLTKFASFTSPKVLTYVDLRFSESEFLVALSGYPHYMLRIWNVRTRQLLVEHITNKKCGAHSLLCCGHNLPVIMQYSKWLREIYIWEMCFTSERVYLHEISKVPLTSREYYDSIGSNMCFSDDGTLYVVNDYGTVSSLEKSLFYLKYQWNAPNFDESTRRYSVFNCKSGLLVANSELIYFVKKKHEWQMEWVLQHDHIGLVNMISNSNGEIYTADVLGNLYSIEIDGDNATLIAVSTTHYNVVDFAIIRSVKEEATLVLTNTGDLHLVDLIRMTIYSTLRIDDGCKIAAHNTAAYVAVSTTNGAIHFLSYEKPRAPIKLGQVQLELDDIVKMRYLRMLDTSSFALDSHNGLHIIHNDFKQSNFLAVTSLERESMEKLYVLQYFLIDETHAAVFITDEPISCIPHATQLWVYQWLRAEEQVRKKEVDRIDFNLPYQYTDFTWSAAVAHKESIEFYGVRKDNYIFDIFTLIRSGNLMLNASIMTNHNAQIYGMTGNRNLLTLSVAGVICHFKMHKKSPKPFLISRLVHTFVMPRVTKRIEECYNLRYLISLDPFGCLKVFKQPPLTDLLQENTYVGEKVQTIKQRQITTHSAVQAKELLVTEPTPLELQIREGIIKKLQELALEVNQLIDYDMSVTGRTQGIFRKFCLNTAWLNMLNEEARILFEMERKSLLESIADQTRIKEWIYRVITNTTLQFGSKIRAIFSNVSFENYALRKPIVSLMEPYDIYRFYDMEPTEDEGAVPVDDADDETLTENKPMKKLKNRFVIQGRAYDHIMSHEFLIQEKHSVTSNQMCNESSKFKLLISDALKSEFNKSFVEVQKFKQEIMDNILGTNLSLTKIYDNMNCMLGLLNLETFIPPELSVPEWFRDEMLEKILTVDDSEIKAANRRRKKSEVSAHKGGRMLLWSEEFWIRALMTMMDGVLEKLWEEEIKKDVPLPDFMTKKQVHEYTLEDQKQLREYDEKVRLLTEDRRKYLRILNENEQNTINLKNNYIMKLNQKCAEMAIMKLKYDFAIKTGRLRLINLKVKHFERIKWRNNIAMLRADNQKMIEYIEKYMGFTDYFEKSVTDIRAKLETLSMREKAIERQLRGQYLPTIPAHLTHEMVKLFKKRPKIVQKSFHSTLVCMEVAAKIAQKTQRLQFPLPSEVMEYLSALDAMDDPQNAPSQLDIKHWEPFVKLRRQIIENELKIKGIGYQLFDAQNAQNNFAKDVINLKETRIEANAQFDEILSQFFEAAHNQKLQITLTMGQIEVTVAGSMSNIRNCILMNIDDINDVNELIKKAGAKKLKSMQRVAFFRRQVIYKEWEHKVARANINYLKYMLQVIQKCKVTMEFLQVLRNWKKIKETKQHVGSFGLLEHAIEQKIRAYRKNLDRIIEQIEVVKTQITQLKRKNQQINKQIDEVKIGVALLNVNRDVMIEEKRTREQNERMAKIKTHRHLIDTVRRDYAHILELNTILELQRLRTYPTLGPAPSQCI